MGSACEAVKVADKVYWVGAVDRDVRDFHGYLTSRGTTYNAFLILADRITLIDTVKAPFVDEMLGRIASVVEPGRIDTIVSNHAEMDHSGALPQTIAAVRPERVVASKMGCKALGSHFHMERAITPVGDGESLDLGDKKLSFVETRMCHWPDSMMSYLHEEGVLFSQDGFGMHLASEERFADELDPTVLECEAAKYYANILLPLSSFVSKALEKIAGLGVSVRVLAPDHGPIRRRSEDIAHILDCYARWAGRQVTAKAVVVYDTMWQSTAAMARAVGEGLEAGGVTVRLMSLRDCHRSDVATELLDAGALIVGSPTINNNVFPTVADVMVYIKGLRPQKLVGAAFGSFGWSGEAPRHLQTMLEEMGVQTVAEPLRITYVPDDEATERCRDLGRRVAEATLALGRGEAAPRRDEADREGRR